MRSFEAPTLTKLRAKLCHDIVHAPEEQLDVITSVDVAIHNAMAFTPSMEWEFDLKDMWLTPSRWTMMINQYLDPDDLKAWLEQCVGKIGVKGRGQAVLRTRTVKPRGGPEMGNKETRRWGSCMLGISYKAKPAPQITLYSRTSYLGYLGALDLTVAWMCGRYVANALGIRVESIAFLWYNESLQFHNFKSLAYLLNNPKEKDQEFYRKFLMKKKLKPKLEAQGTPALNLSRVWMQGMMDLDREGKTLGDMNYNTYRRIRRRYHTEVHGLKYAQQFEGYSHYKVATATHEAGDEKEFFKAYQPLPHTLASGLNFDKLGVRLDGSFGEAYDGNDDNDFEDGEE